jgi:hypothetical protein
MRREHLAHLLRAASRVVDRIELLDDRVRAGDRDRLRAWVRARPQG